MHTTENYFSRFFGVVANGQTYLNAIYLFLSFPLGIFYFVFLITGIAVGVPLIIIWIGLAILLAVYAAWYALIAFERQMAIVMLHEDIPPMIRQDLTGKSLWQKFTATLANPVTWKGLVYLLAKFPLGIIAFTVEVTLVALSASLILAPFYYSYSSLSLHIAYYWQIDTLPEALIASVIGIFVALVSMHILNGLAWVSGKFARVMLGDFSTIPAAPLPPVTLITPELPAAPEPPAPAE